MKQTGSLSNIVIGLAGTGSALIGLLSLLAALVPYFNGDFIAAGIMLIASAISFGFLSVAVLGR